MSSEADNEDRTEEPTQRKLDEAIEKGDVARSQEIGTFFVLCGFTLALLVSAGWSARDMLFSLRGFLMNAHQVPDTGNAYFNVTKQGRDDRLHGAGHALRLHHLRRARRRADPAQAALDLGAADAEIQPHLANGGRKADFRPRSLGQFRQGPRQDRAHRRCRRRYALERARPARSPGADGRRRDGAGRARLDDQADGERARALRRDRRRRFRLSTLQLAQAPAHDQAGAQGRVQEHRRQTRR